MRLALISDIHGNSIALDAVIADVESQGDVDSYWVLGDLAAMGHDSVTVLQRLAGLPNPRFVRGNTDRFLVSGQRPKLAPDAAQKQPGLALRFADIVDSFDWTLDRITAAGWSKWLAELPLEQRLTLPDGTRLLAAHAAPGLDEGPGITSAMNDDELRPVLAGCNADLVCVGHTHRPLDRLVDGVRVVNLGSVSNPLTPEWRASYALLDADTSHYEVQHRRVEYDREAAIAAILQSRCPAGGYVVDMLRGLR